jgi:hypothetical protein
VSDLPKNAHDISPYVNATNSTQGNSTSQVVSNTTTSQVKNAKMSNYFLF